MTEEADFSSGQSVAMESTPPRARHAIALDADVLRWFQDVARRSGSGDHESLINTVLRDHICRAGEPLERTLRRVLREELRKAG